MTLPRCLASALVALTLAGCNCSFFPDDDYWDYELDAGFEPYDAGASDAAPPDAGADAGHDARVCVDERCSGRDDDCDGAVDEGVCTTRAVQVSVAGGVQGEHACAVLTDGRVACWGGRGTAVGGGDVSPLPTPIDGVADALELDVGGYVTCAREPTGVACWATAPNDIGHWIPPAPTAIEELTGAGALSVATSSYCAIVGADVVCSPNTAGPPSGPSSMFWTVALEGTPVALAGSAYNTFVVRSDGTLVGWGLDYAGELGVGATEGIIEDPVVIGLADVSAVCAGPRHTCAVHSGGQVACWGALLGDGTTDESNVPVDVLIDDAVDLTCGGAHTCVVREDGTAWCWGSNHQGQLGNGTRDRAWSPVRVSLDDVAQIDAGSQTTCAVTSDGSAWCWGNNCSGAVGDGTTDGEIIRDGTCTRLRLSPTRVLLP